jgi:hypothetical protein
MSDLIRHLDTYEEFLAVCEGLGADDCRVPVARRLTAKWTTGGMYGRSCWGGELDRSEPAEPEPEDETIVEILEDVAPNLTFVQGRRLLLTDGLYKRDTDHCRDYYGNYTDYATRTLDLQVLYDALREITA